MLPPSCDASADGATGGSGPKGIFNNLRSSLTGAASAIGSAIYKGKSSDVYKVQEPQQRVPANLIRGPSLDLQWAPAAAALRHREPTLPGSRRSLDAPVHYASSTPSTRQNAASPSATWPPTAGAAATAGGPMAARLGAQMQMQQRQRQQQPEGTVQAQWVAQGVGQGPSAMWHTPGVQSSRNIDVSVDVYTNPLSLLPSGDGASTSGAGGGDGVIGDGFFLSGGDTFLMPTEMTAADIVGWGAQPPSQPPSHRPAEQQQQQGAQPNPPQQQPQQWQRRSPW